MREDPPAVLTHQRCNDVHVVVSVPDRHPPHRVVVTALGQAQPIDVQLGDVGPLDVRQQPVGRGSANRQVIRRLRVLADPTGPDRRVQQRSQPEHVRPAVGPASRLEPAR